MCGVAGFVDLARSTIPEQMTAVVTAMAGTQAHRGPDDDGAWVDAEAGIALGHRRLSIIDLSVEGHQPMVSSDGRWVVTFNGEIYNFRQLRHRLEQLGHRFRGRSDTEVLLAAVSEWGVESAVDRFNGMFALGLWDRTDQRLWLARDRLGEKPLYYGLVGSVFLFASELKALRQHPSFLPRIDRVALAEFFRYGYVPSPRSIYQGISKLAPGCLMRFDVHHPEPRATPYWSMRTVAQQSVGSRLDPREVVDRLDDLLTDAVGLRMVSDVPLGAFLSGGIDSSTIVALMQKQSERKVRTFTIGFHDPRYDEAGHARGVARHLGTDHTELYVSPEEAMDVIPRLPAIYDEPFADSSQIPTFLVSKLARRDVTVALSGDGGDELFIGYDRYRWAERLWQSIRVSPVITRDLLRWIVERGSPEEWDRWARRAARLDHRLPSRIGERLHRLTPLLDARNPFELYSRLIQHGGDADALVVGVDGVDRGVTPVPDLPDTPAFSEQLAYLDTIQYLPDDILTKVDRASMAVSLETRMPFLDPCVVELAWRIPVPQKRRGGGKWALREVLYRYVPKTLVQRPKMGFGIPLGDWLRGPLRDWAEEQMDPRRVEDEGYLVPGLVRAAWERHLEGQAATQDPLWDILVFQSWLEQAKV